MGVGGLCPKFGELYRTSVRGSPWVRQGFRWLEARLSFAIFSTLAAEQLSHGARKADIVDQLMERGLTADTATSVVNESDRARRKRVRVQAFKKMGYGVAIIVITIGIFTGFRLLIWGVTGEIPGLVVGGSASSVLIGLGLFLWGGLRLSATVGSLDLVIIRGKHGVTQPIMRVVHKLNGSQNITQGLTLIPSPPVADRRASGHNADAGRFGGKNTEPD